MRTTEKRWLLVVCLTATQALWAQTPEVSKGYASSIRTIDQMLKAENDALLAKVVRESPPAAPKSNKKGKEPKPEPRRVEVSVESIFGAGDAVYARLQVGAVTHLAVPIGGRVGPCLVKGIANQSVFFDTVDPTNSEICPTNSVWRGDRPSAISPISMPNGVPQQQGLPQGLRGVPVGNPIPLPPLPPATAQVVNRTPLK